MREPSGPPAPAGVLFPELLATPEPAPPARGRGAKLLKLLARALLWLLIAVGAFRGLMPVPSGPPPTRPTPADSAAAGSSLPMSGPGSVVGGSAESSRHQQAEAVAATFLREYLTVGPDQAARAQRLSQLSARGVDLRRSVSLPAGVAQYADLVVPADSRPVAGGLEVTVVAHLLHLRSDVYADGGTLAFVVPLAVRREGVAVAGRPRPTSVPVASRLALPRPAAVPASMSKLAGRVAHQAVVALITGDKAALARLGGGQPPPTGPLPSDWRTVSVGPAEVTRTAGELTAEVPVRARPPTGPATYSLPVRVQLEAGSQGVAVRQIDGGGSP
jgi:hypothetical protein